MEMTEAIVTAKTRLNGQRLQVEISIPNTLLNARFGGESIARGLIEEELKDMGFTKSYTVRNWELH
ncbi:hypothetical protein [Vibrio sp. Evd11]|uniref:hypothetical protein n=1 Tax=Vibrio sp. Evd11 TaxID=1207404 RepID=UPI000EFBBFA2|nr:hypothetical protein [Vibrio sp. Evd11]